MNILTPTWKTQYFLLDNTSYTYQTIHNTPAIPDPGPKSNWTQIIVAVISAIGIVTAAFITVNHNNTHAQSPSNTPIILDGIYTGNIEFKNNSATYPIQNGFYRLKITNEAGQYRWQITNTTTLKTYDLGESNDVIHQDDFEVPTIGTGIIEATGRSMIIKSNPKNNALYDFYFRK